MERTLAYNLATELSPKDLANITGGDGENRLTHKETLEPSGSDMNNLDAHVDIVLEW